MTALDPERIGGLAWIQRTKGDLTTAERRRLLGEIVRGQAGYIAGRVRLAPGRTPAAAHEIGVADFRPPDSGLASRRRRPAASRPPG